MWVRARVNEHRAGVETVSLAAWIAGPDGRSSGRWHRGTIVDAEIEVPAAVVDQLARAVDAAERATHEECDQLRRAARKAVSVREGSEVVVVLDRSTGPAQLVVELYGDLIEHRLLRGHAQSQWWGEAYDAVGALGWQELRDGWSERQGRRCRYAVFERRRRGDPEGSVWTGEPRSGDREDGRGAGRPGDREQRRAGPRAMEPSDAYAVLGVAVDAPDEVVDAAWRELVKKNHPDRVASLDAALVALATERCAKINAAREEIRKLRRR